MTWQTEQSLANLHSLEAARLETGFGAGFTGQYEAERERDGYDRAVIHMQEETDRLAERYQELTGESFPNIWGAGNILPDEMTPEAWDRLLAPEEIATDKRLLQQGGVRFHGQSITMARHVERRIRELQAQGHEISSLADIVRRGHEARKQAVQAGEHRAANSGSTYGPLAGGMAAAMADRQNLWAMGVTAPLSPVAGLAKTMAYEAAVNSLSEAALLTSREEMRGHIGQNYSAGEMAADVALAGLFGAGFGAAAHGASKGISKGFRYIEARRAARAIAEGEIPASPDQRAAADIIDQEARLDETDPAPVSTPRSRAEHRRTVSEVTEALERGDPLPERPADRPSAPLPDHLKDPASTIPAGKARRRAILPGELRPPRQKPRRFAEWVRKQGGIDDSDPMFSGELNHRGINNRARPGIINYSAPRGLDDLTREAVDQGWFSGDVTPSEFIDALARDIFSEDVIHPDDFELAAGIASRAERLQDLFNRGVNPRGMSDEQLFDLEALMQVEDSISRLLDEQTASIRAEEAAARTGSADQAASKGEVYDFAPDDNPAMTARDWENWWREQEDFAPDLSTLPDAATAKADLEKVLTNAEADLILRAREIAANSPDLALKFSEGDGELPEQTLRQVMERLDAEENDLAEITACLIGGFAA